MPPAAARLVPEGTPCSADGCVTAVHVLPRGRVSHYCHAHQHLEARVRNNKSCMEPGCHKNPHYGVSRQVDPNSKAVFCSRHKKAGMVNIHGRKCQTQGCMKQPRFDHHGGKGKYCSGHRLPGMVDVLYKPCAEEGCRKHPHFGFEEGGPRYCASHRSPGMVDVKHPRCHVTGCVEPRMICRDGRKARCCAVHEAKLRPGGEDGHTQNMTTSMLYPGSDCRRSVRGAGDVRASAAAYMVAMNEEDHVSSGVAMGRKRKAMQCGGISAASQEAGGARVTSNGAGDRVQALLNAPTSRQRPNIQIFTFENDMDVNEYDLAESEYAYTPSVKAELPSTTSMGATKSILDGSAMNFNPNSTGNGKGIKCFFPSPRLHNYAASTPFEGIESLAESGTNSKVVSNEHLVAPKVAGAASPPLWPPPPQQCTELSSQTQDAQRPVLGSTQSLGNDNSSTCTLDEQLQLHQVLNDGINSVLAGASDGRNCSRALSDNSHTNSSHNSTNSQSQVPSQSEGNSWTMAVTSGVGGTASLSSPASVAQICAPGGIVGGNDWGRSCKKEDATTLGRFQEHGTNSCDELLMQQALPQLQDSAISTFPNWQQKSAYQDILQRQQRTSTPNPVSSSGYSYINIQAPSSSGITSGGTKTEGLILPQKDILCRQQQQDQQERPVQVYSLYAGYLGGGGLGERQSLSTQYRTLSDLPITSASQVGQLYSTATHSVGVDPREGSVHESLSFPQTTPSSQALLPNLHVGEEVESIEMDDISQRALMESIGNEVCEDEVLISSNDRPPLTTAGGANSPFSATTAASTEAFDPFSVGFVTPTAGISGHSLFFPAEGEVMSMAPVPGMGESCQVDNGTPMMPTFISSLGGGGEEEKVMYDNLMYTADVSAGRVGDNGNVSRKRGRITY